MNFFRRNSSKSSPTNQSQTEAATRGHQTNTGVSEVAKQTANVSLSEAAGRTQFEMAVDKCYSEWSAGKFNGPEKDTEILKCFNPDFRYISGTQFQGPAKEMFVDQCNGVGEWLVFLNNMGPAPPALIEFQGFKVEWIKEIGGKVYVKNNSTVLCHKTGKKTTISMFQEWTIDPTTLKPSSFVNNVSNPNEIEAIFGGGDSGSGTLKTRKEKAVENCFAQWGQGNFNKEGKEKLFPMYFSKDFQFIAGQPMKGPGREVWEDNVCGMDHVLRFFGTNGPAPPAKIFLDKFEVEWTKELTDGNVYVKCNAVHRCHATGKSCDMTMWQEWTVDNDSGLPTKCVATLAPLPEIENTFM